MDSQAAELAEVSDESHMGRPSKYPGEKTRALSMRLPTSVLKYLGPTPSDQRVSGIEAIFFEKDLTERLAGVLTELRISAAHRGHGYENDRAETIARLVKLGLAAEEKLTK